VAEPSFTVSVIDSAQNTLVFIEFYERRTSNKATKIIEQFEDAGFALNSASPNGRQKQMAAQRMMAPKRCLRIFGQCSAVDFEVRPKQTIAANK
jgi:hypothetical protein